MPSVHHFYIYSGSGKYVRPVIFDRMGPPSWSELVSKTHELFGVPIEHIALSYRWTSNDEFSVLLTSDAELRSFYEDHPRQAASEAFYKALTLVDLRSRQTGPMSGSSEAITPSNADSASDALVISSDPFDV